MTFFLFFFNSPNVVRYKIVCGRWLVEGNPQVILFDVGSAAYKMNEFKQELYNAAGIGAPHGDTEVNDVVIFGFMVAQFIADFRVKMIFIKNVFHN